METVRTDQSACYRRLKKYKYQLRLDYRCETTIHPAKAVDTAYFSMEEEGLLTVKRGYAWDGPSGPTFDTRTFMRASLVHDALYQLMRLAVLDYRRDRKRADELLRRHCLEDGMWTVRAWYVYVALRLFGAANARPKPPSPVTIVCAPR